MYEGVNVRLTGQDTRRGTFSHRHAVLVDYSNGEEYVPLAHIRDGLHRIGADALEPSGQMGNFTVRDSLLSEYAAVGFEYGYSVEAPEALVAWEAQFGDFANGAQIIIDNFMVAAENKWGQFAGLVLLLPHGYEGQGPEHSSARFERFLSLSARGQPAGDDPLHLGPVLPPAALPGAGQSEAAARRGHPQVDAAGPRLALEPCRARIGLLPARDRRRRRSRIRLRSAASCSAAGRSPTRPCSTGPSSSPATPPRSPSCGWSSSTPGPCTLLTGVFERYAEASEVVWLQEEPENMGAWSFVHARLHACLPERLRLRHVSRPESASPAIGSAALHQLEQADLLRRAIG